MTDDIVTRLRGLNAASYHLLCNEAADEIERLRTLHRELSQRLYLLENGIKNLYEETTQQSKGGHEKTN